MTSGIDMRTLPRELYIGGEWVGASDNAAFDVIDPATEEVLTSVASASVDDAMSAVAAAYQALPAWAARSPRERSEILRRAHVLMIERAEYFARLITIENGKALPDARGEVAYAAEFFRWFAEEAVRNNGELYQAPGGTNRIMVQHQPIGVSLLVTPWNFPAAMATRKIGPALAAGCSVILKPASETPLTALALGALLAEAGVPAGVVNVLPSRRSGAVGSAMLHDPRVRKLSFTGSTEVGRTLLHEAADCVISCSMELGGNAPFLVLEDADIEAAVKGAMIAKMRNAGEACTAANRFYVHASVAQEFARGLAHAMGALKIGPGLEPGVDLGPLVNAATRDKVAGFVAEARDRGATLLTGGKVPEGRGFFYEATVLGNVSRDSACMSDEIFGPMAPIVTFEDVEDAITQANATEYGLAAYLYTKDLAKGLRVSERLEYGMIGLNRGLMSDPAAPFGGVKQSGLGREGAHVGLLEFLETKYIATSW
jgi:succinate-semialdehyde dehydrogenase/glutarate-semialdehyde dehydrogenase